MSVGLYMDVHVPAAVTRGLLYHQLCALVAEEVEALQRAGKELPPPSTRPMREAVPA